MFKTVLAWLGARAKEKSTWVGVATIAGTLVPSLGPIAKIAIGVLGGGLVGVTTTPAVAPSTASAVGAGV